MTEKITFNDSKLSKKYLTTTLAFLEKHYNNLANFFIENDNIKPEYLRYGHEHKGKVKFIKYLQFLIQEGEFTLYD